MPKSTVTTSKIPQELKDKALWCLWKYKKDKNGKPTKVLYSPVNVGQYAKSNDPSTFAAFWKAEDEGDPFNRISGTTGISGSADTMLVLAKTKRMDEQATLSVTGRDIIESETVLKFDASIYKWEALGSVDWIAEQYAKAQYENSPIIKTIKSLLKENPEEGWKGTASQLNTIGAERTGHKLTDTARKLSSELSAYTFLLLRNDNILHKTEKNGTGGKKHVFKYSELRYEAEGQWVGDDTN